MAWAHNSCSRGPKIHKVDWRSEQLGLGPWLPFGGATQVPTTYVITYKCNHLANGHGFGLVRKGFLCRCGKCPHTSQLVKKRVSYGLGKVPKSCHSGPNHMPFLHLWPYWRGAPFSKHHKKMVFGYLGKFRTLSPKKVNQKPWLFFQKLALKVTHPAPTWPRLGSLGPLAVFDTFLAWVH